jgi:hypothetical protein
LEIVDADIAIAQKVMAGMDVVVVIEAIPHVRVVVFFKIVSQGFFYPCLSALNEEG